tara:strand:- start:1466 stop:2245 length:780 start_codon:yes stop_codon:yes gene_type:complete
MLTLSNIKSLTTEKTALYTPIDAFGEPALWYDMHTHQMTSNFADGDAVGEVLNIGGEGTTFNLKQTVGSDKPIYDVSNALVRYESVSFDGTDQHFSTSSAFERAGEVTFACAFAIGSPDQEALLGGTTGGLNRIVIAGPNSILVRFNGTGSSNAGIQVFTNNTNNSTISYTFTDILEVLVMRRDGDNNLYFYNKDGDFIAYYAADANTDEPLQFNKLGQLANDTFYVDGNICEWALWKGDLGLTNAKNVAKALHKKWKV